MKKYRTSKFSYFAIAVVLLLCILIPISGTGSWFTSGAGNQIELVVHIQNVKLNIYQQLTNDVLIYSDEENETAENKSYITFSGEILPDQSNDLTLKLKNEDKGESSVYVRFKVQLLMCSQAEDLPLDAVLEGMTAPTSSANGFVLNSDGYYYYQNSAGVYQPYVSETYATMFTSFTVPYAEFAENGVFNSVSAKIVKLKITIEGSTTTSF